MLFLQYRNSSLGKNMNRNHVLLAIFAGVYSLILFSYFKTSCMYTAWCGQDMDQYLDYSTSLLQGHGYSAHLVSTLYFVATKDGLYIPETMRLPAYPLLLTLGRMLYNTPQLLIGFNILFISIILWYSYRLFLLFFDDTWWMPFIILLVNPTILFYTTQMANVDLFTYAMVTGFIYHTICLYAKKRSLIHIIATCIFGLGAIFSRQNTLLFILPVVGLPIFENISLYFKDKKQLFFNSFFIVCTVFILFLGVWVGRNFLITKTPTISTFSDLQLFNEFVYFSLFPNKETKDLVKWLYTDKSGEKYMNEQIARQISIPVAFTAFNKQIRERNRNYILSHPQQVFYQSVLATKSFFLDTTFVWTKPDLLFHLKQKEYWVNLMLLLGTLCYPLLHLMKKDKNKFMLYMWSGVVCYVLLSAFFHGTVVGNRGILPVYSVIVLLSFKSVADILRRVFMVASKIEK